MSEVETEVVEAPIEKTEEIVEEVTTEAAAEEVTTEAAAEEVTTEAAAEEKLRLLLRK